MAVEVLRRRFTVAEYEQMGRAGILGEDDRVELIDGEIVRMSPIGSRHAACVDRVASLFSLSLRQAAIVRVQGPIQLGDHSQPQPDVALLRPRIDFYAAAHPGPEDVLLVVEVAESSLHYDREIKVPLYARAGIPEAWLADLAADCLWVNRRPSADGYGEVRRLERGEHVAPQAFPELQVPVEALLG